MADDGGAPRGGQLVVGDRVRHGPDEQVDHPGPGAVEGVGPQDRRGALAHGGVQRPARGPEVLGPDPVLAVVAPELGEECGDGVGVAEAVDGPADRGREPLAHRLHTRGEQLTDPDGVAPQGGVEGGGEALGAAGGSRRSTRS